MQCSPARRADRRALGLGFPPVFTIWTEIDLVWMSLFTTDPPRLPAPTSASADRHRDRAFPPGHTPSQSFGSDPPPRSRLSPLWTLECVVRGNVGIHRNPKPIQVDGSRPRRVSWQGFPGSSLSRTLASYGASTVARTSGRGHVVIEVGKTLNPGFPFSLTLKCPLLCSVPSTKVLNTVHSWWR